MKPPAAVSTKSGILAVFGELFLVKMTPNMLLWQQVTVGHFVQVIDFIV